MSVCVGAYLFSSFSCCCWLQLLLKDSVESKEEEEEVKRIKGKERKGRQASTPHHHAGSREHLLLIWSLVERDAWRNAIKVRRGYPSPSPFFHFTFPENETIMQTNSTELRGGPPLQFFFNDNRLKDILSTVGLQTKFSSSSPWWTTIPATAQ